MIRFNHIHGTLCVGHLICIIRRFFMGFFFLRGNLFSFLLFFLICSSSDAKILVAAS